jgi:hypothetical protein
MVVDYHPVTPEPWQSPIPVVRKIQVDYKPAMRAAQREPPARKTPVEPNRTDHRAVVVSQF